MGSRIASRALLSKSFASSLVSCSSPSLAVRVCLLRPLAATAFSLPSGAAAATATGLRCFSTRRTESSLNDPSPNWSNRPPKETILLDGCDFEHWLCVMEPPQDPNATRDDIIDSYIKTLAMVVGSEEEARMKIYSVSTRCYYAFGALVPEEVSLKIKELPRVRWVLPDSYLDVKNKDYGGEPFINGQAVPYDNKYHEEWIRNNNRANERNRRNDRPRNFDRSRNFERRGNMQSQGENGPPPPMQSRPPNSNMPPGQNNMQPPRMQDMQRPPMQNNMQRPPMQNMQPPPMQNMQPPPMQNNMQPTIQPAPMQNNMQPPHMQNNMQRPPMQNVPPPPMQQNPAQNNNMVPPPMYNPAPGMQRAPNNGSFNQAATFHPVQNSEANAPGMQQPSNNGSFNLAATSRSVQNSEPNAPGMPQPPNNGSFNPAANFRPVQKSEPNPGWSNNSQGIVPSYQNTVPGRGYNEANAPNYPHRNDQELPYNQGPPGSGNVYQS